MYRPTIPSSDELYHFCKDFIAPLLEDRTILNPTLLRGYLKVHYDVIYNFINEFSVNAALSLELISERIDDVPLSNLFNMEEWVLSALERGSNNESDDLFERNKVVIKHPHFYTFYKFYLSWIVNTYPEIIYSTAKDLRLTSVDKLRQVFISGKII